MFQAKMVWFLLQAVYLVMLNLCTYESLWIFQSNTFIFLGWLAPAPFITWWLVSTYAAHEKFSYTKLNYFCWSMSDDTSAMVGAIFIYNVHSNVASVARQHSWRLFGLLELHFISHHNETSL